MARVGNGVDLEQVHVHEVYNQIAPSFAEFPQKAWPNVRKFLKEQKPGSLIADVGCGSGRYLHINKKCFKLGLDICCPLVEFARTKSYDVIVADNLKLPYRDGIFDAVISIGVIHHFCSQERRIQAVEELCRVLKPGGQLMIYVWSYEQKHRRFDGQDILIPWFGQHKWSGNFSRSSYSDRDLSSTGSVSEDDLSLDTTSSAQSFQNLNGSLSDPLQNPVEDFVCKNFKNRESNKYLTNRQRSNTLPSTLCGYFNHVDSCISHSGTSDTLVRECRKLEASLKALSASQQLFSSSENLDYDDYEMKKTLPYDLNLNNKSNVRFEFGSSDALDRTDSEKDLRIKEFTSHDKKCSGIEIGSFSEEKISKTNKLSISERVFDVDKSRANLHLNKLPYIYRQKSESSPDFIQCPSSATPVNKSQFADNSVKQNQLPKSKVKSKKLSFLDSLKAAFSTLFEGPPTKDKHMKKNSQFSNLVLDFNKESFESEQKHEFVEFAVREFPLSSCPKNSEEFLESVELGNIQPKNGEMNECVINKGCNSKFPNSKGDNNVYLESKLDISSVKTESNAFLKSVKSKSSCVIAQTHDSALNDKCSEQNSGMVESVLNGDDDVFHEEMNYTDTKRKCSVNGYLNNIGESDVSLSEKVPSEIVLNGDCSKTTTNQKDYQEKNCDIKENISFVTYNGKRRTNSCCDNIGVKRSTELSRYYHVFREGELDDLVTQNVPNVKILRSSYDHANWCLIVEK